MRDDGCVNYSDLVNHSTVYMYIFYTLNKYKYICQLLLNKAGKECHISEAIPGHII